MNDLKAVIRQRAEKGLCDLKDYTSPVELAKMLVEDLKKAIDMDFPVVVYAPYLFYFELKSIFYLKAR